MMTQVLNKEVFVGRQPILDLQGKIYGYELLSRQGNRAEHAVIEDGDQATWQVLSNVFNVIGSEEALGQKQAFVNIGNETLRHNYIELFRPEKLVLELLETSDPNEELTGRCKELKAKGYRIALDDFIYSREWDPFLELVDYIKLDYRQYDRRELYRAVGFLHQFPCKLIAEKIETRQEFVQCTELGFQYFQGYFFARPVTLQAKEISISNILLMELMNLAFLERDIDEMERVLKRDVGLSYRLLCFVNSVGMGLRCKVTSLRHALSLVGPKKLYRWLSLMLITCGDARYPAVINMAITRGRLMELLGRHAQTPAPLTEEDFNQMFLTGLFSLLDVLLESPMPAIIKRLQLPAAVEQALLERRGAYGDFLKWVEVIEQEDEGALRSFCEEFRVGQQRITELLFEASAWAENFESMSAAA